MGSETQENCDSTRLSFGYKFVVTLIIAVLIAMMILITGVIIVTVKLTNQQSQLKDDLQAANEKLRSLGLQFDLLVQGIVTGLLVRMFFQLWMITFTSFSRQWPFAIEL